MTQKKDLIKKMADFFSGEEYYEKGEDARLELTTDEVRCMNEMIKGQPAKGHWIKRHRKHNEVKYHTGLDEMGEEHTIKELIRYEIDLPYCSHCGKLAGDTSDNFCCFCGADMR